MKYQYLVLLGMVTCESSDPNPWLWRRSCQHVFQPSYDKSKALFEGLEHTAGFSKPISRFDSLAPQVADLTILE